MCSSVSLLDQSVDREWITRRSEADTSERVPKPALQSYKPPLREAKSATRESYTKDLCLPILNQWKYRRR